MLQQGSPLARCPFVALAEQLEALASRPLQPRRALLRQLAERFRAAAAAEQAQDRRVA